MVLPSVVLLCWFGLLVLVFGRLFEFYVSPAIHRLIPNKRIAAPRFYWGGVILEFFMNANIVRGLVAVGALVAAGASHAAASGVDVTEVVATVVAQQAPIGLVGGAVLGVYVAVKAFKWVRSALG